MEKAVLGADDDVGSLCQRFLTLIAAGVKMGAKVQLAAALHLATALHDRRFDLERVEGGFRVEAHQLVRKLRRRIRRGAAFPEHSAQAEGFERGHLFRTEIVARDRVDHLAAPEIPRSDQVGNCGAHA